MERGPRFSRDPVRAMGSALVVATVALSGAACGRGAVPSAEGSPTASRPLPVAGSPAPYTPASCEPSGAQVVIVAKADKFSLDCIPASAGTSTTIKFVNKDASSHNLAIYEDPEDGVWMPAGFDYPALFRGDRIQGRTVYEIPPLTSGTYYFRCDIHPLMNGTFLVL